MRTEKKKVSDEAVKAMIARIEHVACHPELYPFEALPKEWALDGIDPDADFDIDITAPLPKRVTSAAEPVISAPGTRKVTIRIPNRIIDAFKASAEVSGGRYQTKMIKALESASLTL